MLLANEAPHGLQALLKDALPSLALLIAAVIIVADIYWVCSRFRQTRNPSRLLGWGAGIMVVSILGAIIATVDTGGSSDTVAGLVGVVVTIATAAASTSFISNAMAGIMLSWVRSFRPGDFVEIGDRLGRVTHCGLFHTELQTEDSDLVTMPNLFLVTHPLKVMRAKGTVVSATVSLGYELRPDRLLTLLKQAAVDAGLDEPFVRVIELGDHSISYRVAGFLTDLNTLLTTRSRLRIRILDVLHADQIEIVSPTFITQRQLSADEAIIPEVALGPGGVVEDENEERTPEERMFDKAVRADRIERRHELIERLEAEIAELSGQELSDDEVEQKRQTRAIAWRRRKLERTVNELNELELDVEDE